LEPEPVRLVIKKKDEGGDAERKDVVEPGQKLCDDGQRSRPSKTWWDCVKKIMKCLDENEKSSRETANPDSRGKRPLQRYVSLEPT